MSYLHHLLVKLHHLFGRRQNPNSGILQENLVNVKVHSFVFKTYSLLPGFFGFQNSSSFRMILYYNNIFSYHTT